MRVNENTAIIGDLVILVPYRREHVEKYHEWMSSVELRELTASEPLTLDQEYEMQRKWQEDEDKLTYIVLARAPPSSTQASIASPEYQSSLSSDEVKRYPMIGDVNLFFKGQPHEEDLEAEAEIMIAEPQYRRKGYAFEALQLILTYASTIEFPPILPVPRSCFVVRIGETNVPSLKMFEKLGFTVSKHVEVFKEIEMRLASPDGNSSWKAGRIISFP